IGLYWFCAICALSLAGNDGIGNPAGYGRGGYFGDRAAVSAHFCGGPHHCGAVGWRLVDSWDCALERADSFLGEAGLRLSAPRVSFFAGVLARTGRGLPRRRL